MPHLFYPIDGAFFHEQLRPILARCWREKNFGSGKTLWRDLLPRIKDFHASYHGLANQTLVEQLVEGLPFDRHTWRAVLGEVLVFAADDLPLIRTSAATLCCLLGGLDSPRERFVPIQQVLFGSRDLVFAGGFYRPDHAGFNDVADVARLVDFLHQVDPERWQPALLSALAELPEEEDRIEEIAFVKESWPSIVALYEWARRNKQVVACEVE